MMTWLLIIATTLTVGGFCVCCGPCNWCTDGTSFESLVATITTSGWSPGTGTIGSCFTGVSTCASFDGVSLHTIHSALVGVSGTDPIVLPCNFDNDPDDGTVICAYTGAGAGISCDNSFPNIYTFSFSASFYLYRSGGDLRGCIFVKMDESSSTGGGSLYHAIAKDDFLIESGDTKTDCSTFGPSGTFTLCSESGTSHTCKLPTSYTLEMTAV